jgi:ribulose 1,5-bisphosphate carboxylase large subunit-like protein
MAARQAIDAALEGIDVEEYSEEYEELREALDRWGRV